MNCFNQIKKRLKVSGSFQHLVSIRPCFQIRFRFLFNQVPTVWDLSDLIRLKVAVPFGDMNVNRVGRFVHLSVMDHLYPNRLNQLPRLLNPILLSSDGIVPFEIRVKQRVLWTCQVNDLLRRITAFGEDDVQVRPDQLCVLIVDTAPRFRFIGFMDFKDFI
jgi:hypothetical protein